MSLAFPVRFFLSLYALTLLGGVATLTVVHFQKPGALKASLNIASSSHLYANLSCGTTCGIDLCYDIDECDCCVWGTISCCCDDSGTVRAQKSKTMAFILSLLLGPLGIDRFYLGYGTAGVGKMLTLGGGGLWSIADAILIGVDQIAVAPSGCPLPGW
ncbi:hypothetical protein PAPYR_13534 [Paratrimastix pyriformis]|uniref:TM2 domain-containing protein n=1 Tax=Paratrimastix pyriformis TaxID=342808 RepID=A0ABQ8UPD3_9EUKA|nr:hypothetical protein PAPYR_13534 [Paratrimastix pyriformis]